MLAAGLPPDGEPSHAYLFHGPAGTGKRAIARAFAAALLADGARGPGGGGRAGRAGPHPDLTWVTPSGAAEMLVADIEEPVVAAAARTPFESSRRVFVIEAVDTMNEQAANRMLKTLEEPPAFVHLLLLSDRREDVLATIASRCQQVRFDPLPPARIAEGLERRRSPSARRRARPGAGRRRPGRAGWRARRAGRCGARARSLVRSALAGTTERAPLDGPAGDGHGDAATAAGERAQERMAGELELLPSKERKRYEREGLEARRRGERRRRTRRRWISRLRLAELWLRDVLCICEGAPELIHAVDRRAELEAGRRRAERRRRAAARGDRAGRRDAAQPAAERVRRAGPGGAGLPPGVAAWRAEAIASRRSARGWARGRRSRTPGSGENWRFSGPWKSAEPVLSRPRAAQRSASSSVCWRVWVM